VALAAGCPPPRPATEAAPARVTASLTGVSPRTTSNQFATPLLVYGRKLAPGQKLRLGAPFGVELALGVDDEGRGHAVLPEKLPIPDATSEVATTLSLIDAHGASLGEPVPMVVVNDASWMDVTGLVTSADLAWAVTASTTTDELFFLETASGRVERVPAGDGPWGMAHAVVDGREVVVVSHRFAPELRIVELAPGADGTRASRQVPGPPHAHALAVHDGVAYVGEHARDTLVAIELSSGHLRFTAPIAPNPRGIAVLPPSKDGDGMIAVGSLSAGEVQLVSMKDGAVSRAIAPRPGVRILGGHTEGFSQWVVGGKAVRHLTSGLGALFVACTGPNVGPNPENMGVSGTGGVGVIDPKTLTYTRHLAFNYGVPQALALDERSGRLYVADVAEGLLHVVDARALVGRDEAKARAARLWSVPLPPPPDFPLFRPAEDFGAEGLATAEAEGANKAFVGGQKIVGDGPKKRRAGVEVHTGPSALALSADGKTLLVLERFTGRVTRLDVSGAASGAKPVIVASARLFDPLVQRDRRLGQVLYFADLGRTGMSCDACHVEGHHEGVFYTKTGMMRLWRSSTVRGVRDTPPYFNPPGHATLEEMASFVGGRNRFQNPPLTPAETERLVVYTRAITTLPNPFRAAGGGLVEELALGEGRSGRPREGRRIFETRCAGCHPPPLFSTDQDEATRRRFLKPGTPAVLELRVEDQDTRFAPRTPPSLVGAWDVWPMFLSGAAGFRVSAEGPWLEAADRLPLRAVLERHAPREHGDASALAPEARADLEAYLMSL
jgi:hypothetical protein